VARAVTATRAIVSGPSLLLAPASQRSASTRTRSASTAQALGMATLAAFAARHSTNTNAGAAPRRGLWARAKGGEVTLVAPLAALDMPLKVLVWEDGNQAVSVSYNSPEFLAARHHVEGALRAPSTQLT
jgi:Domain of unknown function DUF302